MNAIRVNSVIATGGGPLDDQIVYMVETDNVFRFHTPGRVHTYIRIDGKDIIFYQGVEAWRDNSLDQFDIVSSSILPTSTATWCMSQKPASISPRSLFRRFRCALRNLIS